MFRLVVKAAPWQSHLHDFVSQCPSVVPVIKGNGYGFGNGLLAKQSLDLGVDTIAVGVENEIDEVRKGGWDKDIVLLNPWRPAEHRHLEQFSDPHLIPTLSRVEDIERVSDEHPGASVMIEVATSMHRFGIPVQAIGGLDLSKLDIRGWTVHLPASGSIDEARRLAKAISNHPEGKKGIWLSHLSLSDYRSLEQELDVALRLRVGTRLWLDAKDSYQATAQVLDVHRLVKGSPVGYHGRRVRQDGYLLVISGGTSHGLALTAPRTAHNFRQRLIPIAEAFQESLGTTRSPFIIHGKKYNFAEPPHMHSSLIFVPGSTAPVQIGDEVPVNIRMTTAHFDEVTLV